MNYLKRNLLLNYYRLLLKRNHTRWWIQDNPEDKTHGLIDWLDGLYWRMLCKFMSMRKP